MPGLSRLIPLFRATAEAPVPQSMSAARQFVTEVGSGPL